MQSLRDPGPGLVAGRLPDMVVVCGRGDGYRDIQVPEGVCRDYSRAMRVGCASLTANFGRDLCKRIWASQEPI